MISNTIVQIVLIVVSVLIAATYVKPAFDQIKATQAETAEYQEALDNANAFAEELSRLQTVSDSFSTTELARLNKFLPDSVDQIAVMRDIEAAVDRNQLLLNGLSASTEAVSLQTINAQSEEVVEDPESASILNTRFELSLTGSYEDFKNLLRDFEKNDYLLEVIDLNLNTEDGGLFYTYELVLETYSLNNLAE